MKRFEKLLAVIGCLLVSYHLKAQDVHPDSDKSYEVGDVILSLAIGGNTSYVYNHHMALIATPNLNLHGDVVIFNKNKITVTAGVGVSDLFTFNKDNIDNECHIFASSKVYWEMPLKGVYFYTGLSLGTALSSLEEYKSARFYYDVAMIGIHRLFKNNWGLFFDVNPVSLIPIDWVSMGYKSYRLGVSYRF